ncbi:NDP-hexose 2,3-dehydratase family protein [Flavobacterium nackdongense]|uniref:NDP-hexose 2,3-dehydratase n=1 Tax=Flavobacterium nackdongense TaxID=2547394 RepID=A0A4P6YFU9_9FLAO|nr:NDP-hexose 2,3-dehydratase family protein [Flavobacterium nackdongense]QBN19794.1 NDP-hexose 2,3-dehydratase [Flavobacterium nackdongense]
MRYIQANSDVTNRFLKSAFATDMCYMSTEQVIHWLLEQNKKVKVTINKINFDCLESWSFDENKLSHNSGKFFSIEGINVKTNWGLIPEWDQPIINQPEVGYLGFIVKEINGILHFLTQAKIEPGNVNYVQLSPTLQATRSNYSQVHKGKKPLYLEYFQNATPNQILLDQLQSEQGARFLRKRNRNIIIKIDEDIPIHDNFVWLTLGQLKKLMQKDNLVNMDTRTVISGIPLGSFPAEVVNFFNIIQTNANTIHSSFLKSALTDGGGLHSIENIITLVTHLKSTFDLNVKQTPLSKMRNWIIDDKEIFHEEGKFFKVIAVDVEIGNREVVQWSQPMIEPAQEGLCAFVCKEIDGILHFAVQTKLECGNHDIIEFAPTVQTLTGDYRKTKQGDLPFLDYVLNAKPEQIVFDTMQSEEGGRFFREQNRNIIVIAGEEIAVELPEKYVWMTLNQLYTFLKFNNFLNIQARNLISTISFI